MGPAEGGGEKAPRGDDGTRLAPFDLKTPRSTGGERIAPRRRHVAELRALISSGRRIVGSCPQSQVVLATKPRAVAELALREILRPGGEPRARESGEITAMAKASAGLGDDNASLAPLTPGSPACEEPFCTRLIMLPMRPKTGGVAGARTGSSVPILQEGAQWLFSPSRYHPASVRGFLYSAIASARGFSRGFPRARTARAGPVALCARCCQGGASYGRSPVDWGRMVQDVFGYQPPPPPRALRRELIRWVQSLDLTHSVKDARRRGCGCCRRTPLALVTSGLLLAATIIYHQPPPALILPYPAFLVPQGPGQWVPRRRDPNALLSRPA